MKKKAFEQWTHYVRTGNLSGAMLSSQHLSWQSDLATKFGCFVGEWPKLWEHQMSDCFALVWAPIVTGCTASHHVSVLRTTVIGTLVVVNGEFYKEGHKSELLRCEMGRSHMFLLFYHTLQRCLPTNNKRSHPVPIITDLFVPCVHILLHSYTSSQCFFWNILVRLAIWCAFLATKKTALSIGMTC